MSAVPWIDDELALLGEQVARFLEREFVPTAPAWEARGSIDPESWQRAADAAPPCAGLPETYGGGGGSLEHGAVIPRQVSRAVLGGSCRSERRRVGERACSKCRYRGTPQD